MPRGRPPDPPRTAEPAKRRDARSWRRPRPELIAQGRDAARQARLDRADRPVRQPGDLLDRVVAEEPQRDDLTLIRRQPGDGVDQGGALLRIEQAVDRVSTGPGGVGLVTTPIIERDGGLAGGESRDR